MSKNQKNNVIFVRSIKNFPLVTIRLIGILIIQATIPWKVMAESDVGSQSHWPALATINHTPSCQPSCWNKIFLQHRSSQSDHSVQITLLRPNAWMQETGCRIGQTIYLHLPEMGMSGQARVLSIESCSAPTSDTGNLIIATYSSIVPDILCISFENTTETLEPTPGHRLYSTSRHQWIAADQLHVGESVATRSGATIVKTIEYLSGPHRVYNLEVSDDHSYYVSTLDVLGHNSDSVPCFGPTITKTGNAKLDAMFKTLGNVEIHPLIQDGQKTDIIAAVFFPPNVSAEFRKIETYFFNAVKREEFAHSSILFNQNQLTILDIANKPELSGGMRMNQLLGAQINWVTKFYGVNPGEWETLFLSLVRNEETLQALAAGQPFDQTLLYRLSRSVLGRYGHNLGLPVSPSNSIMYEHARAGRRIPLIEMKLFKPVEKQP